MGNMILQTATFCFYTLAMVGVIAVAFFVWRKSISGNFSKSKGNIKIEDALSLSSRKTLLVVSVKDEKFLIASDLDKTTLISKLNSKEETINQSEDEYQKPINLLKELTGKVEV